MTEENSKIPTVFDTEKASIGDVYAKALLAAGVKSGKADELLGGLHRVVEVVHELPKLRTTLESPRIPTEAKLGLLEKALGGKLNNDLLNFLKIVTSKGRFDCLSQISDSATKLYDEMTGNVMAEVITAEPIQDSVSQEIAQQLEKSLGKKVTIKTSVDPGLIGGMVVRIGDTIHDGSVRNQLNQVRTKAIKRTSDEIRGSIDKFLDA